MRKIIQIIVLFICVNAFAQKTYTFDYYTAYEFKKNEQDSIPVKDITIANSKNSNYFIKISTHTNNTANIVFFDLENSENYRFFFEGRINENTDFNSLFTNPTKFNFDLKSLRKKAVDKHDIIYENNEIIVRRYKNRKKKKIVLDYHFVMESNEITKNQFYTSNLVFAYKFKINDIKTDKVIRESFVINYDKNSEKKKEYIRTLTDILPINFTLNIPIENTTK